ncbi:MAG: hypothetical protein N3D16_10605 [Anaerolineales bacterium]|nr:hypothetical protein [Anaerolineales bacterium]
MSTLTLMVVLLFLLVFAGMVIFAFMSARKAKEAAARMAQTLGMTPVPQPDSVLLEQITALYRTSWEPSKDELLNVSRRLLPDGELFLFDLVATGGESHSIIQSQAVAIRSNTLRLPHFQMHPKVDTSKYALGGLANAIVEWGVSKVGTPVRFPEFPAFDARYAVTSNEPEATRRFFDEDKTRYFANTEYYGIHAGGNLFTFAEVEPGFKINDPSQMTRRITRALEVYRLFGQ